MATDCTTQGDGDLYGLGVRIGLYLQWAAGFLLRNMGGSWRTISTVRMANNALCIAIVLTTVINTARGTSLSTDYLIVYYITVALFYSESYNVLIKETGKWGQGYFYILRPDVPLLIQNFLFALATSFGAWFWLKGYQKTAQPVCTAKAAMLGVFDLEERSWRMFATTFAILGGIAFSFFFVIHFTGFAMKGIAGPVTLMAKAVHGKFGSSRIEILKPLLKPSPANVWKKKRSNLRFARELIHYFLVNIAGPLMAIISVERMISANHLVTSSILESSGQMIALFSGASSLCAAIWELCKFVMDRKPALSDLVTSHIYNSSQEPPREAEIRAAIAELTKFLDKYTDAEIERHRVRRAPEPGIRRPEINLQPIRPGSGA